MGNNGFVSNKILRLSFLQSGYSLVEITLVLGFIVFLVGIATLNLFQYQHSSQLASTANSFIADYKEQQIKAMIGDTSGTGTLSNYGINFGTTNYTEFQNSYGTNNLTVTLPLGLQFSTTFPNSQIIFLKGSGMVSGFTSGKNTITMTDTVNGAQAVLTVNQYGVITNYSQNGSGSQPTAPVLGSIAFSPIPATQNTAVSASAPFTSYYPPDTASWIWGDGNTSGGSVTENSNSGFVTNNHTYTSLGSFTASLTVTNTNNASSSTSAVIAVIPTTGYCSANLSHTNYSGANFSFQNLCEVNISTATFNTVNFTDAILTQINGSNSSFTGTNFTGVSANGASFSNSNFTGANFTNAVLTNVNLSNGTYTNANFTGANLTGANITGGTFTGVTWSNTTCPGGTNSNNDGNTCVGH